MEKRVCWNNCRIEPNDAEVQHIDALENALSSISPELRRIRGLITSLEMCHHKAERWVFLIVKAIGARQTAKGPGTRPPDSRHPVEDVWERCIHDLSVWRGDMAAADGHGVGEIQENDIVSALGEPTDLKKWQVGRVIDKVQSYLNPGIRYIEIVESPEHYADEGELRRVTMSTIIRDQVDAEPADISLAASIDHLEGCHWDFSANLMLVLHAIGGDLFPSRPYASCGRNIKLSPLRLRAKSVSDTLRSFWDESFTGSDIDESVIHLLGPSSPEKRWLSASLDKTIRLQFGL